MPFATNGRDSQLERPENEVEEIGNYYARRYITVVITRVCVLCDEVNTKIEKVQEHLPTRSLVPSTIRQEGGNVTRVDVLPIDTQETTFESHGNRRSNPGLSSSLFDGRPLQEDDDEERRR